MALSARLYVDPKGPYNSAPKHVKQVLKKAKN
jgi:hypothetical protein